MNNQTSLHQIRLPLRQFVKRKEYWQNSQDRTNSIFLLTKILYGLANILNEANKRNLIQNPPNFSKFCSLDNFFVRIRLSASLEQLLNPSWKNIIGVDMIVPDSSLDFIEPAFLDENLFGDGDGGEMAGTHLEVQFRSLATQAMFPPNNVAHEIKERALCYLVGLLMYELVFGERISQTDVGNSVPLFQRASSDRHGINNGEPARKRSAVETSFAQSVDTLGAASTSIERRHVSLGTSDGSATPAPNRSEPHFSASLYSCAFPSSILSLLASLLEYRWDSGRSAPVYGTLEGVSKDLHRAILEPSIYLFPSLPSQISAANDDIWCRMREIPLYGREKEKNQIRDTFLRVSMGSSEAFIIGGESGVGKTRLVQSLLDQVRAVNGFVVMEKFDQIDDGGPYSSVLYALNLLCCEIAKTSEHGQLLEIASKLMNEFYSDFSLLVQLLPSIFEICPQVRGTFSEVQPATHMTLHSVSYMLRRFVKSVSNEAHPVMISLDDMQWSNHLALGLIQSLLYDLERTSCLFFVGSYRSDEVGPEHAIFSMVNNLETCGVRTTRVELAGLGLTEVNNMISDILCVLPHMCWSLSELIFQNTRGNPFFAIKHLESLLDKNLIFYSLNERRWMWHIEHIQSESVVNNVIDLISSKILGLDEESHLALKTLACFGIKIIEDVAEALSSIPQYSNFLDQLEQAIRKGFIERMDNHFRFIHDKFLEASYNLIPSNLREQFHFQLAVSLHSLFERQNSDALLICTTDQFKKAPGLIARKHSFPIDIPSIFVAAGSKMLERSDFPRAHSYLQTAQSLLSHLHWNSNYSLCLRLFLQLARASYACGMTDEATSALDQIIENGRCFEDKLEAYYLMLSMKCCRSISLDSFDIGNTVLAQLHRPMPDSLDPSEASKMGKETLALLKDLTDDDLMQMKEADEKLRVTLKFYSAMCLISFFRKPELYPFYISNLVQLSVEQGLAEYSSMGFAGYAFILLRGGNTKDIPLACRIGKLAFSFQKRFDLTKQMPLITAIYYSFLGPYSDPFQTCAEMHRQAYEIGFSSGEIHHAFQNPNLYIGSAFCSGANLPTLLKETKDYGSLATKFDQPYPKYFLQMYRDTIIVLSSKRNSPGSCFEHDSEPMVPGIYYFHLAVRSFWLGHHVRCEHASKKFHELVGVSISSLNKCILSFVEGLSMFQRLKTKNTVDRFKRKCEQVVTEMKGLAGLSKWNFDCKYHLLEAEFFSLFRKNDKAEESYAAAIASSNHSQFVHEEGLAQELAASHYLKNGNVAKALSHFEKAKICYEQWGSQMKVEDVTNEIEKIQRPSR